MRFLNYLFRTLITFEFLSVEWKAYCCCCSAAQSRLTLCDPTDCSVPGLLVLHYLSEFAQTHVSIELVMPFNNLIFCHPLLLLSLVFPGIRLFSSESALPITWPKYWSFSFSISPSNESVQLSRSVMSDSLRPHESQHARPPCPSQLPEFTQTHVHRVCDAIQPSHPLLPP